MTAPSKRVRLRFVDFPPSDLFEVDLAEGEYVVSVETLAVKVRVWVWGRA